MSEKHKSNGAHLGAEATNEPLPAEALQATPDDTPPDGGYGWVCVAASFWMNAMTWGQNAAYGIYLSHYLADSLFPEATPLDYALIGGLTFALPFAFSPLITPCARLIGPNKTMLIGVVLQCIGFVCASFANKLWHLYLCQGMLQGIGMGFIFIPSYAILSQWFLKKRSLANGIAAAGSGTGGLLFTFMIDGIINKLGIDWAFRVTAILLTVINTAGALLIKSRNELVKPHQRGFDTKLLKRVDVLLLLGWAFLSILGYIILLWSLPNYARDIGLSRSQATIIGAVLNVGTIVGRPVLGVISDKFGKFLVAEVLTLAIGVFTFSAWLPTSNFGATIAFAFIIGLILGVFWVLVGPLCAEVAGLAELQSLLSLSWVIIILPSMFSEVIALALRRPESNNPYLYPQIFCGTSYILAAISLEILRRRTLKKARNTDP